MLFRWLMRSRQDWEERARSGVGYPHRNGEARRATAAAGVEDAEARGVRKRDLGRASMQRYSELSVAIVTLSDPSSAYALLNFSINVF